MVFTAIAGLLIGNIYLQNHISIPNFINERGMWRDFRDLKKHMDLIIKKLDHSVLLNQDDKMIKTLNSNEHKIIVFPTDPTTEIIATLLCVHLLHQGPYDFKYLPIGSPPTYIYNNTGIIKIQETAVNSVEIQLSIKDLYHDQFKIKEIMELYNEWIKINPSL